MYENKDFEEGARTELFRVGRDFEWEARTAFESVEGRMALV
jgi:hypothetical protein